MGDGKGAAFTIRRDHVICHSSNVTSTKLRTFPCGDCIDYAA